MLEKQEYSNFLGICLGGKNCKKRRSARQDARAGKKEGKNANTFADVALKQAQAQLLASEAQGGGFARGRLQLNSNANLPNSSNNLLLYGGIAAVIVLVITLLIIKKKKSKK